MSISKLYSFVLCPLLFFIHRGKMFTFTLDMASGDLKSRAGQKSQGKRQLSLLENRAFSGRISLVNPAVKL